MRRPCAGNPVKNGILALTPPQNIMAIRVMVIALTPIQSQRIWGNCASLPWMMTFSKPRNKPMFTIVTNDEKTPHSPKASGVYRRVRIGVTIIGNIYMIMLLTEIFALFFISGVVSMSFSLFFKTYIS